MHGHVDLGTGLRTALTQIVAEELSVSPSRVHVLMGMTALSPNQGATIASASIQVHAKPLQAAAAQAAWWLRQQAARLWVLPIEGLVLTEQGVQAPGREPVPWGRLLHGLSVELLLDLNTPLKDRKSTRLNSSHVSESRMPSSA